MSDAPIFIVGIPRSGSTLLSAILGSHSRISCGPETNFFRVLSKIDPEVLCNPQTWPEPAVNFICSITQTGYGGNPDKKIIDKYQLSKDEIINYLEKSTPSIPNILSSITAQYMHKFGKSRWVEKTPDHVLYMETIRRYFPDSPTLQIFRDPRDVALSLMKTPWGAETYSDALFYWENLIETGNCLLAHDELAYSLHYENLVRCPYEELTKLCDFLDEKFEPGMLDTSVTGKRLNSMNVTWKEKASQPIDASRVNAWRVELPKEKNILTEALIGDHLMNYDYSLEESFVGFGELFPSKKSCADFETEIESIASEGIRFWKLNHNESSIAKIYLGNPGSDAWLGANKTNRLFRAVELYIEVFNASRLNKRIYWVTNTRDDVWSGYLAHLLKILFRPYRYLPRQN